MNTTPSTSPEFGVYTISKDYINHLRKTEPKITDPEITNTYCGPVCRMDTKRGPVDYFVPVDVDKFVSNEFIAVFFIDGIFADIMDFNTMIPCLPSEYKTDTTNDRLVQFCIAEKERIQQCAETMIHHTNNQY